MSYRAPNAVRRADLSYIQARRPPQLHPQSPVSRERACNYKVLVVDDSRLARMVMASAFRRLRPDWELVEATGADEALGAIELGRVDIALIDFNMPGIDGLELVARIRESEPAMPIAVVSANLQDEIIARARELKAAFIAKPLTDEALGRFPVRRGSAPQESEAMSVEVVELTPIERDAFAEIANMGVSRAATSLRQMLGEQVLLSVRRFTS